MWWMSLIEWAQAAWAGPKWRWWSLAGGLGITAVSLLIWLILEPLMGQSGKAVATLILFVAVLILSLIGSGMIEGVSQRVSGDEVIPDRRPGRRLSRREQERERRQREEESDEARAAREQRIAEAHARRDRRTVGAALALVPVIAAFLYMLFTL